MNHTKREYTAEILALCINIITAIVVVVVDKFSPISNEIQFIVVVVVVSITAVFVVFKKDIIEKVNERIDLYRLFDNIDDKDLREKGVESLNVVRTKLEELSRGLLVGQSSELTSFLSEKVANAKKEVKATLVVETPESLQRWTNPPASNYYAINKKIVKEGKKFQRIFIIKKATFLRNGTIDEKAAQLIIGQKKDGLDVFVVWEEDLRDLAFREDFVIVDQELVHINDNGAVTLGGWRTRISKNKREIHEYEKKFDILLTYAQRIDNAIGGVSVV
jgi:hypothetical protein